MYDNDKIGYVFCVSLIVGHIVAWAFWHYCAKDYYHPAATASAPAAENAADSDAPAGAAAE